MVLGLYPFTDIAADGAPRLDAVAGEELVRVERAAALALGHRAPEPPGALFLTTKRVIWIGEGGKGYAVDFIAVSLHAVSRDPEAYPSPCIYTQVCSATTLAGCFLIRVLVWCSCLFYEGIFLALKKCSRFGSIVYGYQQFSMAMQA